MAKKIQEAGKFNRRVQLMQREKTKDSFGQPVETWVPVAFLWANIMVRSGIRAGDELDKSDVIRQQYKSSIRIRWRTGIVPDMRIHHLVNGVTLVKYRILSVINDPDGVYIDLVCETVN